MYLRAHLSQALCTLCLLYQIRPTSAGCKKFTYVLNLAETLNMNITLDSLACHTGDPDLPFKPGYPYGYCQFPPKIYDVTVLPQLSASLMPQRNFSRNCPDCYNLLELSPGCTSICWGYSDFTPPEPDEEDQAAISALAQEAWKENTGHNYSVQPITASISFNSWPGLAGKLLWPGYNYTLVFVPKMQYIVGIADGCVNKTLDGLALKVGTFGWHTSSGLNQSQGLFIAVEVELPASNGSTTGTEPKRNAADTDHKPVGYALVWMLGISVVVFRFGIRGL